MTSFATFCFAFLTLSSHQLLTSADLIAEICDKTIDKGVCQSTFSARPESKNADLNGLASIAVDAAIKQTKDIQAKVLEASKSAGFADKERMIECSNGYVDVAIELQNVKNAFGSKSYSEINARVSALMSTSESCRDDMFKEYPAMQNKFKSICGIVLPIANRLNGKP